MTAVKGRRRPAGLEQVGMLQLPWDEAWRKIYTLASLLPASTKFRPWLRSPDFLFQPPFPEPHHYPHTVAQHVFYPRISWDTANYKPQVGAGKETLEVGTAMQGDWETRSGWE